MNSSYAPSARSRQFQMFSLGWATWLGGGGGVRGRRVMNIRCLLGLPALAQCVFFELPELAPAPQVIFIRIPSLFSSLTQ